LSNANGKNNPSNFEIKTIRNDNGQSRPYLKQ